MELWEYQVIHLNVEAPAAAAPAAPPASAPQESPQTAPPPRPEAVFSKEYLAKEFPGFYGSPPSPGAPAKEHPAQQLRGFLNLQGQEGWQLLGFYPVGQLTMMIFRRPLSSAAAGASGTQGTAVVPPTLVPPAAVLPTAVPPAVVPPAAAADAAAVDGSDQPQPPVQLGEASQAPVLERILSRLEALESRLSPAAAPPQADGREASREAAAPHWSAGLQDGQILPAERCRDLEGQPRLSTAEAARALDFRSAASLLNLAARSGYRPGLIKRGPNAAVAIYMGSEKNGRGGRDRRLWVVVDAGSS